jgi:hypothetical protein
MLRYLLRDPQNSLRNKLPVGTANGRTVLTDYVKHYRIIGFIFVVPMRIPVRRTLMYFDITRPHRIADTYFGIEKIRSRIGVPYSGVDHKNGRSIRSYKVGFCI